VDVKRRARAGGGKPKIDDVANAAGVSTATVSRALNNSPLVTPELKNRVEAVALKLGYLRHGAASALASNASHTIGAVIPTLNNAIFAASVEAFERRLNQSSYTLLVAISRYDPVHETRQIRRLLERGVDGLMLIGNDHSKKAMDLLRNASIPCVFTYAFDPKSHFPNVGFDNRAAAFQMAQHLYDLGHRKIAIVIGITKGNDRASERLQGLQAAFLTRGLVVPGDNILERPYTIEAGRQAMCELLSRKPVPTAVICGNDVLAFGVIFEAAARGLAIPKDLSVSGFDNLPFAAEMAPAITTISIPSEEMGVCAAESLLNVLDGTEKNVRSACLDAPLLIRGTTAPPKSIRSRRI